MKTLMKKGKRPFKLDFFVETFGYKNVQGCNEYKREY